MWPSYSNGEKITKCNQGTEVKIHRESTSLFDQMDRQWVSYTGDNSSFWTHEYNSHGYCWIKKYNIVDYRDYFRKTLEIFNKNNLETLMRRAFGDLSGIQSFGAQQLEDKLQQTSGLFFDLDCISKDGEQYLREVRFYFDLNFNTYRDDKLPSSCNYSKPVHVIFQ